MTIPIVFSTNKNFVEYTAVCIYSMLCNADKSNEYDIYIFNVDLTEIEENMIKVITKEFENTAITFVKLTEYLENVKLDYTNVIKHLSLEVMFRIFIPTVLNKYEKVIYLDSDMIVLGDITELFKIDICNNIIGAVVSDESSKIAHKDYIENYLKMDLNEHFNSGVLIINNQEFESNDIKQKCIDLMTKKNNYVAADQCVLNVTTNKKVFFIDKTWNTAFSEVKGSLPNIIHYLGAIKPWNYLSFIPCNDIFWKYAKLCNMQEKIILKSVESKKFENYYLEGVLPFQQMPENSKIVLYGANMKGLMVRRQLESLSYYKFVMQCDKNYENLSELDYYQKHNFVIKSPAELLKGNFDYIVICANTEAIKKSITNDLIDLGVSQIKIVQLKE